MVKQAGSEVFLVQSLDGVKFFNELHLTLCAYDDDDDGDDYESAVLFCAFGMFPDAAEAAPEQTPW